MKKLLDLAKSAFAFVTARWQLILAGLAAVLLSYQIGHWRGYGAGKAEMRQAIDRANVVAEQAKARADALAANQRLTDTIAVSTREREMIDAVRQGPDSAPDDAARRLGCERLRAANPTAPPVPACR